MSARPESRARRAPRLLLALWYDGRRFEVLFVPVYSRSRAWRDFVCDVASSGPILGVITHSKHRVRQDGFDGADHGLFSEVSYPIIYKLEEAGTQQRVLAYRRSGQTFAPFPNDGRRKTLGPYPAPSAGASWPGTCSSWFCEADGGLRAIMLPPSLSCAQASRGFPNSRVEH
ncbi:hypothetical protein VUR80DRAFT_2616 [Thermomyces stellatus]